MGSEPDTRANELERRVIDAMTDTAALDSSELVVHFDLVATTRSVDPCGHEHIQRHHFAVAGADPHMSFAVLQAAADTVRANL